MKAELQHRQEFLQHRPSKPDVESSSLSSPTTSGQPSDTPNISRSEGLGRTAKSPKIPDRWLQGRSLHYERKGYDPRRAILFSIADWREQERLEQEFLSQ